MLLTIEPQLHIYFSEEKFLKLIGQKESVASFAITESQNPRPTIPRDAVF